MCTLNEAESQVFSSVCNLCPVAALPTLVSSCLLKPLGNAPLNGVMFFSTADVLELSRDRAWLVKMTNAVCQHWQRQNVRRKGRSVTGSPSGPSSVVALAS